MKNIALLSGIALSPWANMPLGAYDADDPDTKAAVQAAIDAALEEAREEHESEVARLNNKNSELLGKLAKARKDNGGDNTEEISRLERELDETKHELGAAQSKLRVAERDLKRASEERDAAARERDSERENYRNEFVENRLTSALSENNVASIHTDAVKALLKAKNKITVEGEGDERQVLVNGKPLGDFVKEYAASDAGKHYVVAPANSGGDAKPNGNGNPNGLKKLEEYTEAERLDMARNRPEEWKRVQEAANSTVTNPIPVIA